MDNLLAAGKFEQFINVCNSNQHKLKTPNLVAALKIIHGSILALKNVFKCPISCDKECTVTKVIFKLLNVPETKYNSSKRLKKKKSGHFLKITMVFIYSACVHAHVCMNNFLKQTNLNSLNS